MSKTPVLEEEEDVGQWGGVGGGRKWSKGERAVMDDKRISYPD